jgi:glycosyltransferase involved in cell wall biosynthesis
MKTVCFVSLRCAVGLQKEIESLSVGFRRCGWRTSAILAEGYRHLCSDTQGIDFVPIRNGYTGMLVDSIAERSTGRLKKSISKLCPDLILFYNQSPLNVTLARYAKRKHPSKVAVCLHDPWKQEKLKYGLRYAALYAAVERLQARIVQESDWVLTLSELGTDLVKRHYPYFRGLHTEGRILLKDIPFVASERMTVSIIGRINRSTGHEEFMALARDLRGSLPGVVFEVVTSSVTACSSQFIRLATECGVTIRHRKVFSEREIEEAIARSICVFRLDQELTQSGVIPVCFRAGVPVVVRDIPGLTQHVVEGVTGFIYRSGASNGQLIGQINDMRCNAEVYAKQCCQAFRSAWAEECFDSYYGSVLDRL